MHLNLCSGDTHGVQTNFRWVLEAMSPLDEDRETFLATAASPSSSSTKGRCCRACCQAPKHFGPSLGAAAGDAAKPRGRHGTSQALAEMWDICCCSMVL